MTEWSKHRTTRVAGYAMFWPLPSRAGGKKRRVIGKPGESPPSEQRGTQAKRKGSG